MTELIYHANLILTYAIWMLVWGSIIMEDLCNQRANLYAMATENTSLTVQSTVWARIYGAIMFALTGTLVFALFTM